MIFFERFSARISKPPFSGGLPLCVGLSHLCRGLDARHREGACPPRPSLRAPGSKRALDSLSVQPQWGRGVAQARTGGGAQACACPSLRVPGLEWALDRVGLR